MTSEVLAEVRAADLVVVVGVRVVAQAALHSAGVALRGTGRSCTVAIRGVVNSGADELDLGLGQALSDVASGSGTLDCAIASVFRSIGSS